MTTVNYLTKTELPDAFKTSNLDPTVQQAVVNQLILDGLYAAGNTDDGRGVWVESDIYNGVLQTPLFDTGILGPKVSSLIQVLEVEAKDVTVQTDSTLKVIVDDGSGPGTHTLTVTGGAHDVFIGLGNNSTRVTLQDHGNDTVLAGDGNDTLIANGAADSLIAGSGNDSLVGGSGHDTLVAASGHDTLVGGSGANYLFGGSGESTLTAGSGQHSLLQAGSGNTVITDLSSGGYDTLVAGSGSDTITGQQGDYFNPSMPASGNDVYNIHDGHGNSTINLFGNDTVNFFTTAGKDTINNGGGVDTVDFTHSSNHDFVADIKSITAGTGAQTGDWTIKFNDGQSVQLNGHADLKTQDAFVLHFDGMTVHLKGGS
jgi:hypothetical protein